MRVSLADRKAAEQRKATIRRLQTELLRLQAMNGPSAETEATSGGDGLVIDVLSSFPAVPTSGYRFIIVNNALWFSHESYSRWYALDRYTSLSGIPV